MPSKHLMLATLLVACSGPTTSSTSVGPEGGVVVVGPVRLAVPAGALEETVTLTVREVDRPGRVQGLEALGPRYEFLPAGLTFAQPVEVRFALAAARPDAAVYWADDLDGPYERLATTLDGGSAVAEVTHFSVGFAGAPSTGTDAGVDASVLDGGSDAALPDAGTDAGAPVSSTRLADRSGVDELRCAVPAATGGLCRRVDR